MIRLSLIDDYYKKCKLNKRFDNNTMIDKQHKD